MKKKEVQKIGNREGNRVGKGKEMRYINEKRAFLSDSGCGGGGGMIK